MKINRMEGYTMSSLMKGTAILTIGLFLSKLLGLIYIFPFYAIVGQENIGLYQYAYIPYNIMLSIAIAGLPVAISKFVSKRNALGDFDAGRRLVKTGALLMIVTGILSFIIVNLLADPLAHIVIKDDEQRFTTDQVATIIRWVSYAILVVPFMSLVRGFMQGYGHFLPTSVSQLIEQIGRIVFLLVTSFIIVRVMKGDPIMAVNLSVFAAFIGAIFGLLVMYYYWKKLKPEIQGIQAQGVQGEKLPYSDMYREVFRYAVPVVFVGLANSLFQLIDMLTFNRTMVSIGLASVTDDYFTMINFLTHKIVIIPVMLATGFSMALIPTITKLFTQNDEANLRSAMDKTYQVLLFITVPAAIGISLLAKELYHVLYSESAMGAEVLAHYAPVAILFALFSVTAALLQGIDRQKWLILSLLIGLLVKVVTNVPFIKWLEADGAILATALGYAVTVIMNIIVISKTTNYKSRVVQRRILLISILTGVMALVVFGAKELLYMIAPADTKLLALLYALVCAGLGAAVYGLISFKLGLAQKLLGDKVTRIAAKLGFK
jgi:O-antigen/teichoic acid export membrane protein